NRQTSDYRRLEEIAVVATFVHRFRRFASERNLPAFLLSLSDVELDLLKLCLACDRALVGFIVERIAHFQLRRLLDEALDEIAVSRALDEHARAAQANLSLVCEGRTQASGDGRVEIGVRKNDVRVFPAELERDLLEEWRACFSHFATCDRTAGK